MGKPGENYRPFSGKIGGQALEHPPSRLRRQERKNAGFPPRVPENYKMYIPVSAGAGKRQFPV